MEEDNYNLRFTHLAAVRSCSLWQPMRMGCVFINLVTVMLCVVAFEYFNQKRKVARRVYGYYLEYFL